MGFHFMDLFILSQSHLKMIRITNHDQKEETLFSLKNVQIQTSLLKIIFSIILNEAKFWVSHGEEKFFC